MDLVLILSKTIGVNCDQAELEQANNALEQATRENFPELIRALSDALANVNHEPFIRQAAGLQLKNRIYSKDTDVREQYKARWLSLPQDVRHHVRMNSLNSVGTEKHGPSAAAQCVAHIAIIELPLNLWPEVITVLTSNVTNPASTEMMKEASLEAIGYICQDIEPELLVTRSNDILTAIVHGMRKEETNPNVRCAATKALHNSLEFTKANFDNDSERHFIMQVVCEATQSTNENVKVAALQCLVKIMSLYYQYMETYMGPALFAITVDAMKSENDQVALQGIEFWSNVCDEEVDLSIEASEAQEHGRPPARTSRFYARGALQYLVPILMHTLTKQDNESDDDDEWNPCKAAGVCLMLMSSCCEDAIIQHVLPFVNQNIRNPEWRYRDAAVMAFGSILEGPDPATLKPIVESALPTLIELMKDPSVVVRDTVAWAIGRICDLIPDAVLAAPLESLVETLLRSLNSEPRVAANVCWAFNSLAEAAYEHQEAQDSKEPDTYKLSRYFEFIVTELLKTTERADANQANLRSAAYEALIELIKNSVADCYPVVITVLNMVLTRLQQILTYELSRPLQASSSTERSLYSELKSLLCATLQACIRKLKVEDAISISDGIMTALLSMFNTSAKTGCVQEDALMSVGTLVEVLGDNFLKYMEAFTPYLALGLKNYQEHQVCNAAVGLVGDICRSIGQRVLPYCDQIMQQLIENLNNENLDRSVKPQILSVFGDIALAIGVEFRKYLPIVMDMLMRASQIQPNPNDFEYMEYVNDIRENCLEAYTGIVQGLKGDREVPNQEVQQIRDHIPSVLQFILVVSSDAEITDNLIAACAGLIGDICAAFGTSVSEPLAAQEAVINILNKGKHSRVSKTRLLCSWALKAIRNPKVGGQRADSVSM
ncbi:importin subunit beta Fs(2)Ket [Brevipalpus obovatus]|uniref:importin subunit beta Fs(2)Ket n=1 Tax=Brevipalpus obovatus TaxID=246614 RepID=UPI003D9E98F1